MATYRQRIAAQEEAAKLKAASEVGQATEDVRKKSLSPEECFSEGYRQGVEDARDGYLAGRERSSLGEDYGHPESFRAGYVIAYDYNAGFAVSTVEDNPAEL